MRSAILTTNCGVWPMVFSAVELIVMFRFFSRVATALPRLHSPV